MKRAPLGQVPRPTRAQIAVTKAVVEWYFHLYFRTPNDPGSLAMFSDRRRVGHFAIERQRFARGDPDTLFRLFIATVMFQRRRDVLVQNLLRSFSAEEVRDLSHPATLAQALAGSRCSELVSADRLHQGCDLRKSSASKAICGRHPRTACVLKDHTTLLRRYGDFGKYPASALLMLREFGAGDLKALYRSVLEEHPTPQGRAEALEGILSRVHRVGLKLANMYLALTTNAAFAPGAPWSSGVAAEHFVVIDSNVEAFLLSIGYVGPATYASRRLFIQRLSEQINLKHLADMDSAFNPRLVQQAMYVFMGRTSRLASTTDCMHSPPGRCGACPLLERCPVASTSERIVASVRVSAGHGADAHA